MLRKPGFFIADILKDSKEEVNVVKNVCIVEREHISASSSGLSSPKSPWSGLEVSSVNTTGSWSSREPPVDLALPAWIFCTRYSDRPSSGPRMRKIRKDKFCQNSKRSRASFTLPQINRLATEFETSRYLSEIRRRQLARELDLKESQVKIWFQNKRAKTKKATGVCNSLALYLMAEGLYNHSVRVEKTSSEV